MRCFNVWNLIHRSDLHLSIDFLSFGCFLPPAKLPNIRALLAISSYDAPILHDVLRMRLQSEISSPKEDEGKGSLTSDRSIWLNLREGCCFAEAGIPEGHGLVGFRETISETPELNVRDTICYLTSNFRNRVRNRVSI